MAIKVYQPPRINMTVFCDGVDCSEKMTVLVDNSPASRARGARLWNARKAARDEHGWLINRRDVNAVTGEFCPECRKYYEGAPARVSVKPILRYMEKNDITPSEFARRTSIPLGTVDGWHKGRTRHTATNTAYKILYKLGLAPVDMWPEL